MKDYRVVQQRFVLGTYAQRGITITHGDGVHLYDSTGKQYLDMMTNYGVNILGYSNRRIRETIQTQSERLLTLHGSFANDARAEASMALVQRCGVAFHQVYWSNSGAEAVEAALKFAVLATGKKRFISMKKSYHGKTLGALSPTDGEKYRAPFEPLLWDFDRIPFNDINALEQSLTNDTAAVILEPIQGEGGIIPAEPGYLKQVQELCLQKNVLVIADEIQCGMGRSGSFLVSTDHGMEPDILCLGKGLAGGLPVGATVVSSAIAEKIPKLVHSSTFGGNPLVCAVTHAVLDELNDRLLEQVQTIGSSFLEALINIQHERITKVRGAGLMIGVEVSGDRNQILKKLQENSILAIPAGEQVVRFLPPYTIQTSHVDQVIQTLVSILNQT